MSTVLIDYIIASIVMISIVVLYGVYMYKAGVKYGQDHTIVEVLNDNDIICKDNIAIEK